MTEDILKRVNKDKLEESIKAVKDRLGPAEAAKVDAAMTNTAQLESLVSKLGKKETDMLVRMLNDPKAMKTLLASPKVAELIRQFINK